GLSDDYTASAAADWAADPTLPAKLGAAPALRRPRPSFLITEHDAVSDAHTFDSLLTAFERTGGVLLDFLREVPAVERTSRCGPPGDAGLYTAARTVAEWTKSHRRDGWRDKRHDWRATVMILGLHGWDLRTLLDATDLATQAAHLEDRVR